MCISRGFGAVCPDVFRGGWNHPGRRGLEESTVAPRLRPGTPVLLPVVLALALVVRVVFVVVVPPSSDVYYYLTEGVQALLRSMNPYNYTFTGIPAALVTPGAEHVFAYLPFTLDYLAPFYIAATAALASSSETW